MLEILSTLPHLDSEKPRILTLDRQVEDCCIRAPIDGAGSVNTQSYPVDCKTIIPFELLLTTAIYLNSLRSDTAH